jgi:hypothetical protein
MEFMGGWANAAAIRSNTPIEGFSLPPSTPLK